MCPWLDTVDTSLNLDDVNADWELKGKDIVLIATQRIKKNTPIYISYGSDKSATENCLDYGISDPMNSTDLGIMFETSSSEPVIELTDSSGKFHDMIESMLKLSDDKLIKVKEYAERLAESYTIGGSLVGTGIECMDRVIKREHMLLSQVPEYVDAVMGERQRVRASLRSWQKLNE